jgi:hypothetical protein
MSAVLLSMTAWLSRGEDLGAKFEEFCLKKGKDQLH